MRQWGTALQITPASDFPLIPDQQANKSYTPLGINQSFLISSILLINRWKFLGKVGKHHLYSYTQNNFPENTFVIMNK